MIEIEEIHLEAGKYFLLSERIIGYDIARALAVFGMVMVNFKTVMGAAGNGPDWLVTAAGLLDGRAAATFVVLAGAGISLLTRQGYMQDDHDLLVQNRRTLLKRAFFLFVIGLLYTPVWPADILHFYGVYIALAAFLLATSSRRLWVYTCSLVLTFAVMLLVFDYEKFWDWNTLTYERFWTIEGMVRHLFFNGFHPVLPWLAFLLLGMILGRQDMRLPAVQRRIFVWGVAAAIAAEFISGLLVRTLLSAAIPLEKATIIALVGTGPMPPMPLYMLAGAGTACAVIAASIAIGQRYDESFWIRPLVAAGQLALTLYVGHVVVGLGLLEVLGYLGNQTLQFAVLTSILFCMAGVTFAYFWQKWFARGPLESLLRTLTGMGK